MPQFQRHFLPIYDPLGLRRSGMRPSLILNLSGSGVPRKTIKIRDFFGTLGKFWRTPQTVEQGAGLGGKCGMRIFSQLAPGFGFLRASSGLHFGWVLQNCRLTDAGFFMQRVALHPLESLDLLQLAGVLRYLQFFEKCVLAICSKTLQSRTLPKIQLHRS